MKRAITVISSRRPGDSGRGEDMVRSGPPLVLMSSWTKEGRMQVPNGEEALFGPSLL